MARRGSNPWSVYSDNGVAFINTRIAGQRLRQSLGVPYPADATQRSAGVERRAQQAAAERYAKLVSGRTVTIKEGDRVTTSRTLHELLSLWLADVAKLYPSSIKMYVIHARTFAATADACCGKQTPLAWLVEDDGPMRFAMHRLTAIIKETLRKELTTLFKFLGWAKLNGAIAMVPPRPKLDRGLRGKRSGTQRAKRVDVTADEARRIVESLPEWAARGGRGGETSSKASNRFRVRDPLHFAWETGLRPATVARIAFPTHWAPGRTSLSITEDIDKSRYGREVPLTAEACAILARCCPSEPGTIFGAHDYRNHIKAAAAAVLAADKAIQFSGYDFRHARTTESLHRTGNMLGVAYLVGHKRLTTTDHYAHASERHAREAVDALDLVSGRSVSGDSVTVDSVNCLENRVRRRGLEPLRCYPLAPQGSGSDCFCAFGSFADCTNAHENAEETAHREWARSVVGQCASEWSQWLAFDRLWLDEILAEADEVGS
jgi:integrase